MKKIFLKLTDAKSIYWVFKGAQTQNFMLQNLYFFLTNTHDNNLSLSTIEDKIILWNSEYTKQMTKSLNNDPNKYFALYAEYHKYAQKRWDDMPKLKLSLQNYETIVQTWNNIVDTKPEYIILSQDDAGYVDLIGKDELSQQDLQDMKIEHEKYLKYKTAYDKYVQSRPDIVDELWHGPESSEYEADWQKFLDEPLD